MLPPSLQGPEKSIRFASPDAFLSQSMQAFPNLDPDFILQICFEHPTHFDNLLPGFDPTQHCAVRREQSFGWVYENVRYNWGEQLDFWYEKFDSYRVAGVSSCEVFNHMIKHGMWPFPPVVIESTFAESLGITVEAGRPYHLIEGTHYASSLICAKDARI
jgi:hypothetical protein